MRTYEEENAALLTDILEDSFFKGFRDPSKARYAGTSLELNITASCNQKCEYCYLTKYGTEIYPVKIRKESDILKNTQMLVDYFIEQKMNPGSIDLFSGEIWGTKLANGIFDIILDAIKNKGWGITYIMIPSNMSFILNPTKLKHVEYYIEEFKKAGCRMCFSASIDGPIIEEQERSFKDEKLNSLRNKDFYDQLFVWCKKNRYAFHPMVSAHGIDKWIDNYKWWQHMFTKYRLDPIDYGMYLEVRNDEWNLETIDHYYNFLNYMIDYDFKEIFGSEMNTWMKESIIVGSNPKKGYFPYVLLNNGNTYNCTINTAHIVRMGDLAIGPCHRTHYEKFLYGKYKVEDGKIVGIEANNVQLANLVLNQSHKGLMKCEKCPISMHCMRGCLGAQYEATGEILQPCESVCHLLKARVIFLYTKYTKMGLFDYIFNETDDSVRKSFVRKFTNDLMKLKEGEPKLWNYWETKALEKMQ